MATFTHGVTFHEKHDDPVVTLRCNMILEDGIFYKRGTILNLNSIPQQWRGEEYITQGRVDIDQVSEIDEIEIEEGLDMEDNSASPMQEMELKPRKRLLRRK